MGVGAACLVAELPRWAGRAGLQALCPSKLAACCPSQLPNKNKERMPGSSRVCSTGANGLASLGLGWEGESKPAVMELVFRHYKRSDAHSLLLDAEKASRVPWSPAVGQKFELGLQKAIKEV